MRIVAELAMIDEKLCRAELSHAERAKQTARRKAIYVELHPETVQGGNQSEDGRFALSRQLGDTENVVRFTADTAAKIGKSERAVQRDAERGEAIDPSVLEMAHDTPGVSRQVGDTRERSVDGARG